MRDVKNNIDESFIQCFSDALKGNIIKYEQHIKFESDESWFVSKYISVFIEGELIGVSITVTDVTAEKQTEIDRERAYKTIGMLYCKP